MTDYDIVEMPDTAEAFYRMMRGSDVLGLLNAIVVNTRDDYDAEKARLDELCEPLVHRLHDAAEDYDGYIVALLYASALLAMTALGQLEVDGQMWQLGQIDGPDDLGRK